MTIRVIPFIYNSTVAYKIELGYKYAKVSLNDVLVCQIITPYLDTDLLAIHYKQIGDTLKLVHSSYPPQEIKRASASVFTISEVVFDYGPFLTRNDLIDVEAANPAYMKYTGGTIKNSVGNLLCCESDGTTGVSFFDSTHVGALFKLITKRTASVSAWSCTTGTSYKFNPPGAAAAATYNSADLILTFLELSAIDVKGTYTFTTSNYSETNTGTIVLERSENGGEWEIVRRETSSIIYSGVEKYNNVKYRSRVLSVTEDGEALAGTIKANITVANTTVAGIVKVIEYIDASNVFVKVITGLDTYEGQTKTRRWSEGAWSGYRGYPSSITHFEDRAIYGGMMALPEQAVY